MKQNKSLLFAQRTVPGTYGFQNSVDSNVFKNSEAATGKSSF